MAAKHKLVKKADKETGKPDMSKNMSSAEVKNAVAWLFKYLGIAKS